MKLHGSSGPGPSLDVNGSGPSIDDDEPLDDGEDFERSERDFSALFDAPSYSEFIKLKPNSKSKTYERKTASMMKAGLVMALQNHQWADAATFMKHGPGVATAAGNLAAEDARAARLIDMLTAPESPYVMFALVALPMVSQLFRNHEQEAKQAASTWRERRAQAKAEKKAGYTAQRSVKPITVRVLKREFKLPIRFSVKMPNFKNWARALMTPTQYPDEIAAEVFNDVAVVKALHKMGIFPRGEDGNEAA